MIIPFFEIINTQKGKNPPLKSKKKLVGYMPYIDIKAFEHGIFETYTDGKKCLLCDDGDILLVWDGARAGLVGTAYKGTVGSTLVKIDVPLIQRKYIFYFLQYYYRELNAKPKGTGIPHINPDVFNSLPFPIFPISEQHRIVEKIDSFFSELDNGTALLKTIKTQLVIYRQAVLNDAFSCLSETNPIIKLTSLVTSGSRGWAQYYSNNGAKFIRIGNLTRDRINIDLTDTQYVNLPEKVEGARSLLIEGDILISITADLGSIGFVETDLGEAYINQHIALVRFNSKVQSKCLAWFLRSDKGQKELLKNKRGAGKLGLGLDDIRNAKVPVITDTEALSILQKIESRLSVCDKLEKTIDETLALSASLRQSILKMAFEGRLVAQDPNDEPAEKLLERIKAEKAAVLAKQKQTRKWGRK